MNFDNQTITTSNPSLKPQTADNFDIAAEYYFEPAGVVSVGLFQKEIKNFIFTSGGATVGSGQDNGFDGDYAGYAITTQYNGGAAKVRGIELNYSQQFTFLRGIFSGLGAYGNYTRMETEGNYGAGNAIAVAPNPKGKVAGFNPETSNVGLSYIRNKITVRLQFNNRGRYLTTYNVVVVVLSHPPGNVRRENDVPALAPVQRLPRCEQRTRRIRNRQRPGQPAKPAAGADAGIFCRHECAALSRKHWPEGGAA